MDEVLEYALADKIRPDVTVKEFDDIPQIFHQLKSGTVTGRVVIKIPKSVVGK